jgi:Fur family transcriptional regulator, ferric uptake regulator
MKNYIPHALEQLKLSGLKITKPRQMIVNLLAKSDKALSPYEMRDILKKKHINADVVTIYRVMEVLENIALAHKVLAFSGYIRCNTEKIKKSGCHHYLLCGNCHRVDEVEGENLHQLEIKISKKHKFEIKSHYLEFMGLCETCQKRKQKQK